MCHLAFFSNNNYAIYSHLQKPLLQARPSWRNFSTIILHYSAILINIHKINNASIGFTIHFLCVAKIKINASIAFTLGCFNPFCHGSTLKQPYHGWLIMMSPFLSSLLLCSMLICGPPISQFSHLYIHDTIIFSKTLVCI